MRARGTVRDVSAETALVRRAETKADPELEGGEAK
jgi:hypothetical protein